MAQFTSSTNDDYSDALQALQLRNIVIRNTYVSDLALFFQFNQCFPAFLNFFVWLRPVHLIQINAVNL